MAVDEVLIRAALRDEISRPVAEIRGELGQLRLALNVVADAGRRSADSLGRIERSSAEARDELGQLRLALGVVAAASRRTADSLERMEAANRGSARAASSNARETRSAARALGGYARQARDATRATLRLTGAVLGLNAAMRGARGLVGGIAGVRGGMKALILLFATLIPAAVPVAAVVTGAFLSMAGAASVLLAGLPVLALGLNGVGDAVAALASGDIDKINETFARLTDTGRTFATYLFSLQPVLDQLRGAAQVALLPGLQSALEVLVTALPGVTGLVSALGGALGDAAVQLATAFAGPGGQAFVGFLTANAPAINAFTGGLISLAGSLGNLLIAFAPLNGVVNSALGGVLADFAAFADGSTGRLQTFIGYIEQAMGPVGDFLTGFGRTLLDLLEALGQPGLVVLGAVNDLLGLLSTLAPLVGDVAQAIGVSLAGVFQALIPIVEQLAPVLGDVLITAATGVADALIALAPHVGTLATFLTTELLAGVQALIPYLQPLGEAFLGVLDGLAPLLPIALSLIPVLGDTLLAVFAALTPAVTALAPVIGQLAADLLTSLLPVVPILAGALADLLTQLTPLLPVIGDQLVAAFALIIPQLPALVSSFLDLVGTLIPLLPPLTQIAVDLLPLLVGALVTATPLVVEIAGAFRDNLLPVLQFVADVLDRISGFFTDTTNLTALRDTAKLFTDVVTTPLDKVGGPLKRLGSAFLGGLGIGDTDSSRTALTGTLAVHSAIAGGGVAVSNTTTGGGGRGHGSGDHQAGRALDLIGPGTGAYKRRLVAAGGWGEFHGTGAGRHLHAVYPRVHASTSSTARAYPRAAAMGDTATSRTGMTGAPVFGGDTFQVSVVVDRPGANVDVAAAVRQGIDDYRRELAERRSTGRF